MTGLAQNPLYALFRPQPVAKKSQKITLWVAMALRDFYQTC